MDANTIKQKAYEELHKRGIRLTLPRAKQPVLTSLSLMKLKTIRHSVTLDLMQ